MPAIHEVEYFGPSNQAIPLFKTFIQIAAIMVQSRVFFEKVTSSMMWMKITQKKGWFAWWFD